MKRGDDGKWGDGGRGFHPVRMWHLFGFLFVVFVALGMSVVYRRFEAKFGFGGKFEAKNDGNCELLVTDDGPYSTEDFAEYQDGLYFVSAGDLGTLFGEIKHRAVKEGKIWIFDANTKSSDKLKNRLHEVTINGLPAHIEFHPHGIHYSKKTGILYVVSHAGDKGGEQVFTFSVVKTGKKGVNSIRLKFERTVTTPEYNIQNGVFNDIVEGTSAGEFYMTQFLPGPLPKSGKPETFEEHVTHATNIASMFFLGRTHIHRCTFDPKKKNGNNEDVKCEIAATDFSLVNGITVNDDRDTYWVADGRNVFELKREKNGQLTKVDLFFMPHMGDNIEWDRESGDLWVGALPNPLEAFSRMGQGLTNEGSLHVIHRTNGKMTHSEDLVYHKGNQLGSVSAGFIYQDKVVLGSPFHNGVLVCTL